MAIFRRESESEDTVPRSPERPASGPQPRPRATHIAPGSQVVGEITGATDVRVDGHLEGEVDIGGAVVVGPEGRVEGKLAARTVEVGGRVEGDVQAQERITLTASAELLGDLAAPRVTIDEGAFFKGQVEMGQHAGEPRGKRRAGEERGSRPTDDSVPTKNDRDVQQTEQGGQR